MIYIQDNNFNFIDISEYKILNLVKDKFVIALDFDGVITDPYKLKTFYLNEKGYRLKENECSVISCLNKGVSKEDHEYASQKAFTTEPRNLPLEKDFLKYFNKINDLNEIKIFILTSRNEGMLKHLEEYLRYYQIKVDGVVNTKNKNKSESLIKIKANIFVDDSPFKLWQILKENNNINCKLILYRNVQNSLEKKPSSKVIEVNGWEELINVIMNEYKNID